MQVKFALLALLFAGVSHADYLGTDVNRVLLDPQSLTDTADGFQANDEVSFVLETTPRDTGSTVGAGSWGTAYIPDGVEVIRVELVIPSGGVYIKIPAKDVGPMAEDCGPRGCDKWPEVTDEIEDAPLGPGQQDSGIFYSTDPRTARLNTPWTVVTSGSSNDAPSGTQDVWNDWDYDQVLAFGAKKDFMGGPLLNPGQDGKGNTALVSTDNGATWQGTGSPVAGPLTFFRNDYNPDCNTPSTDLIDDLQCVGPWQRIKYENAKIGALAGGVALQPPSTASTAPLLNSAVLTTAGHDFGSADDPAPLPAGTNAVRFVHGIRRLGDLEYARITFRIVDAAAFVQSVYTDRDFCLDSTGSDTDKPGRGAQDNIWRYYEGNAHTCYEGSADANFVKFNRYVNNVPSSGGNLAPDDILGFEVRFTNTSGETIYDLDFADVGALNLDLLDEGEDGLCPYASYDSVPAGANFNNAGLPVTAAWSTYSSLAAGASVSVFICGAVDGGVKLGDQVKNTATVTYALTAGGSVEPELESTTLGTVSSQLAGTVYADPDGSGTLTAGDQGLGGVTVALWDDDAGSVDGEYDAGDTLLRTTVTASNGSYEFNGFFGDFIVVATDLALYTSTGDKDNGATCGTGNGCNVIGRITLADDEKSLGNDFFDEPPPADLSLVKTVDNASAPIGSTVTFTLALSNAGPGAAAETSVTDVLPDGFSYVDGSMTGGTARDQSGAPTLVWTVDSLAADATVNLTFQGTVNGSGNYKNVAEVTATVQADPDSTPGNDDGDQSEDDEASATVTPFVAPAPQADLSLAKAVSNTTPAIGSSVTFTLTLSNAGPDAAAAITVTDVLPDGFTYIADSISGGTSPDQSAAPTLVWTVDSLASGDAVNLTFAATVNASGNYSNVAEITASIPVDSDSTPNNNNPSEDDQDSVTVTPPAPLVDLALVKLVDNSSTAVGSTVTFTLSLTNTGPNTATNITVTDVLPDGFTYTSASMTGGDNQNQGSAPTLVWTVDSLAVDGAEILTFQATVNATGSNYTNVAQVSASSEADSDSTPGNDDGDQSEDDEASVTVTAVVPQGPVADLSLTKAVSNTTASIGSSVTFTLTLSNAGPDPSTAITVTDVLPDGFTYVANSIGGGSLQDQSAAPILQWTVNLLASGDSVDLTFDATVNPGGTYRNVAEVTASVPTDSDSTPNNNNPSEDDQDSVTVTPPSLVDLALTNEVDNAGAAVGSKVTFTLTLTNSGPATASNIMVTDVLPDGFSYTPDSMTGGDNQNQGSAPTLVWTVDSLAVDGIAILTFQATVNASGNYTNLAQVSASSETDSDSTPGNDDGDQSEDDEDFATISPTAAATVPTLSAPMLGLLGLLLAMLAMAALPRRQAY